MSTLRERVLGEIAAERDLQDRLWSHAHDSRHRLRDWVALLARHLGLAVDDGHALDVVRFRRQMVRVAALALAAVEATDSTTRSTTSRVGTMIRMDLPPSPADALLPTAQDMIRQFSEPVLIVGEWRSRTSGTLQTVPTVVFVRDAEPEELAAAVWRLDPGKEPIRLKGG